MDKLEKAVRHHIAREYRNAAQMVRIADGLCAADGKKDHYLYAKAKAQVGSAAHLEIAVDQALDLPHAGLTTASLYGWDAARFA